MGPPRNKSRGLRPYGLVPSVVTFALVPVIVVLLFEYTNVFNSWLAWVIVPAVVALVAYDVWLRGRPNGLED